MIRAYLVFCRYIVLFCIRAVAEGLGERVRVGGVRVGGEGKGWRVNKGWLPSRFWILKSHVVWVLRLELQLVDSVALPPSCAVCCGLRHMTVTRYSTP